MGIKFFFGKNLAAFGFTRFVITFLFAGTLKFIHHVYINSALMRVVLKVNCAAIVPFNYMKIKITKKKHESYMFRMKRLVLIIIIFDSL